jgi:glutathione S-transferase
MRTLYHFRLSPYSRRARLALAHKGLDCELRDARENPALLEEARALVPFRTVPVLVDDGRAMGDSTAIVHWLDRAYPQTPRLWPDGADDACAAYQVAELVDLVQRGVVDVGNRYYALHGDPAWDGVKREILGRAGKAAEGLAARVATLSGRTTIASSGWSAADMWLLTMVLWFEGMPARAAIAPNIAQILTLGFALPPELPRWANAHRDRSDVRALG